jgi:hypothetical protein
MILRSHCGFLTLFFRPYPAQYLGKLTKIKQCCMGLHPMALWSSIHAGHCCPLSCLSSPSAWHLSRTGQSGKNLNQGCFAIGLEYHSITFGMWKSGLQSRYPVPQDRFANT